MKPTDPRWIGAWWIGFLLFGILGVIAALPLLLYPRRMVTKSSNGEKTSEVDADDTSCFSVLKGYQLFEYLEFIIYLLFVSLIVS